MLAHVEKTVARAPFRAFPKLIYLPSHRTLQTLGRRFTYFQASESLYRLPGVIASALLA